MNSIQIDHIVLSAVGEPSRKKLDETFNGLLFRGCYNRQGTDLKVYQSDSEGLVTNERNVDGKLSHQPLVSKGERNCYTKTKLFNFWQGEWQLDNFVVHNCVPSNGDRERELLLAFVQGSPNAYSPFFPVKGVDVAVGSHLVVMGFIQQGQAKFFVS